MLLRNIFLSIVVCLVTVGVSLALAASEGGTTGSGSTKNSAIEQRIMEQIRQSYQGLCGDCRFEFKQIRIPEVTVRNVEDLHVVTEGVSWAGSFLLPLEVGEQRLGWISGQVKITQQGLVARRALQPGENLATADLEKDWIDVTFVKDQLVTLADLQRLTPKKFIGVRQALLMSDLRKVFVVQRGQSVKVTYGDDSFEITTSMKAEENGAIGDTIRVKNTETQKILSVRVDKENSARIE